MLMRVQGPAAARGESTKQHLVHLLPLRVPLLPRPFPDFMRDQIGCNARILQIAVRHHRQFLAAMMTSRPQLHGQCDAKTEISQSLAPVPNPAG
jgi:hypothetical protein